MPSIPLHRPPAPTTGLTKVSNPLPALLQTPTGLALLEIQGTIHAPFSDIDPSPSQISTTSIGRLEFPLYDPSSVNGDNNQGNWMKKVHLYIGKHQRLTGEVKRLSKPVGIIRMRSGPDGEEREQELEIVEIVRWKILFSARPEPVGEDVVV